MPHSVPAHEKPAPRLCIRLLWWFGIYFAGQLPLIPWIRGAPIWAWFIFPTGSAWWFLHLTFWVDDLIHRVSNAAAEYFVIALMILPWVVYVVHLVLSLRVRRRQTFMILMWVLGAIVLFNLGSCSDFLRNPPQ